MNDNPTWPPTCLSRRHLLTAGCAALISSPLCADSFPTAAFPGVVDSDTANQTPIILHQTDLFRPHGDPDDHFDLATLFALALRGQAEVAAVVIDYPPALRRGDPDLAAVAQMNRLCGTSAAVTVGAKPQMSSINDTMPDLDKTETAAIDLILATLRRAPRAIQITCVGSATDLAVAAAREPKLFSDRCAALHLDAGGARENPEQPGTLEFNARLNPVAFASLFSLGAPLYWYPCWDIVEKRQSGPNGTFYWLPHRDAFAGISKRLKNFFVFMFDQTESAKWLHALDAEVDDQHWEAILTDQRGMWSTASILRAARQTVTRDGDIVPVDSIDPKDELYRMEPVEITCAPNGRTDWKPAEQETGRKMFHLLDPQRYPGAMTRAVNTLLKEF